VPPVTPEEHSNWSSLAVPDTSFASVAGSVLGAPVTDGGIAASADLAAEASPEPAPPADPERTDFADSSSYRPAHAEMAARTFDVAATRRRPVVFEEDDDLDVPDFLK
jgi:cell division protein FtsZ